MGVNKFVYYGETLFDITGDTVSADTLKKGITATDKTGTKITGTNTNDVDSTDATVAASEMMDGKTGYARGNKITGTMPNNGGVTGEITTVAGSYAIPLGFHDGSGKASISAAEQAKIIAGNIKQNVTILGVKGTYAGEAAKLQSKTITPGKASQTVTADTGYDALSSVTVNAIPYTETENSAGGTTVTIG